MPEMRLTEAEIRTQAVPLLGMRLALSLLL